MSLKTMKDLLKGPAGTREKIGLTCAAVVGGFAVISQIRGAAKRRRISASPVYASEAAPTVAEFQRELDALADSGCMIERVDLDRVDADNFSLVLVKLFERRRRGPIKYSVVLNFRK